MIFFFLIGITFGSELNLYYLDWIQFCFYFVLLILTSISFGLILSSLIKNKPIAALIGVGFSISTLMYNILMTIRPNLLLMFPSFFLDFFKLNPFTAVSSMMMHLSVKEKWTGFFDPSTMEQNILTIGISLLSLLIGSYLFYTKKMLIKSKSESVKQVEKNGSVKDFLSPALLAILFIPLQFILEFIIVAIFYYIPVINSLELQKILVLLIGSIFGSIIVYFILLPRFKLASAKIKFTVNKKDLSNSISLFSLYWIILMVLTTFFSFISLNSNSKLNIFTSFNFISIELFSNFLNLVLWILGNIIFLVLLQELLYRRLIISLLEKKGISPLISVLMASITFAIVSVFLLIEFESKLFTGSLVSIDTMYDENMLLYVLYHLLTKFLLGSVCGLVYILTRNVFYPVLTHSLNNLSIFLIYIALMLNNQLLVVFAYLLLMSVNIIGFLILLGFFIELDLFNNRLLTDLVAQKSKIETKSGLIGFTLVFLGFIMFFLFYPFSEIPFILAITLHGVVLIIIIINSLRFLNVKEENEQNLVGDIS